MIAGIFQLGLGWSWMDRAVSMIPVTFQLGPWLIGSFKKKCLIPWRPVQPSELDVRFESFFKGDWGLKISWNLPPAKVLVRQEGRPEPPHWDWTNMWPWRLVFCPLLIPRKFRFFPWFALGRSTAMAWDPWYFFIFGGVNASVELVANDQMEVGQTLFGQCFNFERLGTVEHFFLT